jgi:hypothetical protein
MKPRLRTALVIVLILAWTIPALRAASFCARAIRVYHDEQSVNAWNDLAYSAKLAAAYLVSLAVPAALLFLRRLPVPAALALVAAGLFIAGDTIRAHPERVIVLFPSMSPLRPVGRTAIAVCLVGALCLWQNRRGRPGAPPGAGSAGPPSASAT